MKNYILLYIFRVGRKRSYCEFSLVSLTISSDCLGTVEIIRSEKHFFVIKVLQLLGDVTKKEVCEELVDKTLSHFGELDILVRLI